MAKKEVNRKIFEELAQKKYSETMDKNNNREGWVKYNEYVHMLENELLLDDDEE